MRDTATGLLAALTAVLMAAGLYLSLTAPPDVNQGELVRLYYIHVPTAWVSYLAYLGTFVFGLLYLIRRNLRFDRLAASSAEIGVLMTALTLFAGSLWAKPTWGTYWTWDPRLTTTAVGLLIYVGYFIVRGLIDDPARRARVAAVLGIVGTLYIPINYMSVYWWRSIHQTATVRLLDRLEVHADQALIVPFYVMLAAFTALFVYLLRLRAITARREAERERARDDAQLQSQGGLA